MIIDIRSRGQILDEQPLLVWVILSLEISVELSGKHYLLAKYPYYALPDQRTNEIDEGHWYPPFLGFTVEIGTFPPHTVGDLVDLTDRKLASVAPTRQLEELAHAMGFGAPGLHHCGTIFEIKASPTFGSTCRAYRIERYTCRPRGLPQIRYITDPECLKGHVFIPLDDIDALIPFKDTRKRARTFLGKPLISNLQCVIDDKVELQLLKSNAIHTTLDAWSRAECGFLILVDIAGFGTACQFAAEKLSNMFERGDAIANRFRLTIGECFQTMFAEVGIAQSRFTGDGFIVGVPDRMSQDEGQLSAIKLFIASYLKFVTTLTEMNERIAHGNVQIGSRIAIHYGPYKFGRIGGPTSISADFDGDTLIEVARSEAALSKFTKTSKRPSVHSIAMTAPAFAKLEGTEEIARHVAAFESLSETVKERSIMIRVGFLN